MKISLKTFGLLLCLVIACFARSVEARPIVGDIDFSGVVTFDTMSLATATQVVNWNSSFVTRGAGDLAGITFGTPATMSAWAFSPSTPTPLLWQVAGFTFSLQQSVVVAQSATFLNITGYGTISSNDPTLDPTPGVWTFTSSNSSGNNQSTFSFQVNTSAVPEPGTYALCGVGMVLLLLLQRRRRAINRS